MDDRAAWEAGWSRRGSRSKYFTRSKRKRKRPDNTEELDKKGIWDAADEYWTDDDDEDYFEHEEDGSWDLAD